MNRTDVRKRLESGGLTGLIGGEEKRESKIAATIASVAIGLLLFHSYGILVALGAFVIYSVIAGLILRWRKRRAGVPLDSTDY